MDIYRLWEWIVLGFWIQGFLVTIAVFISTAVLFLLQTASLRRQIKAQQDEPAGEPDQRIFPEQEQPLVAEAQMSWTVAQIAEAVAHAVVERIDRNGAEVDEK